MQRSNAIPVILGSSDVVNALQAAKRSSPKFAGSNSSIDYRKIRYDTIQVNPCVTTCANPLQLTPWIVRFARSAEVVSVFAEAAATARTSIFSALE